MRNLFLSLMLFFFITSTNYSQDGEWGSASFHGFFTDIQMIDASTGWITNIGYDGSSTELEMMQTIDGGISWIKRAMPAVDLMDFDFISLNSGWSVHDNGAINYSNNGGKSWIAQTSGTTEKLRAVDFIDATNGWVAGGSNYPSLSDYMSMSHVSAQGHILRTTNAGNTWTIQQNIVPDPLVDIFFKNTVEGWAIGIYGSLLHTTDAGANWSTQQLPDSLGFGSIFFADNNNGWIAGFKSDLTAGTIKTIFYRTTDGGNNWNKLASTPDGLPISFTFKDGSNGWAEIMDLSGGSAKLYSTVDGGTTWTNTGLGFNPSLFGFGMMDITKFGGMLFTDSNNGYLVDGSDAFFTTTDGGSTWNDQRLTYSALGPIPTPFINDVYFHDSFNGWISPLNISGLAGPSEIYKTTNGGAVWSTISTSVSFNSIYFADLNNGWALNENKLYQSTDGGSTWTLKSTITTSLALPGSMPTEIRGDDLGNLFVRDVFGIMRSSDGGATWTLMAINMDAAGMDLSYAFASIYVIQNTCWFVGKSGIFFIPPAALSGYIKVFQPAEKLNDIFFIDSNKGWAVGENGYIVFTIDGGTTWNTQNSTTIEDLYSVIFFDADYGWASTGIDFIYTLDGGTTWNQYDFNLPLYTEYTYNLLISGLGGSGFTFAINYSMALPDVFSGWMAVPWALYKYTSFQASQDYLRVVSPNGGENWQAGTSQNITWIYNNVTDVKLEYSTDGGINWITIAGSTPAAANSYSWTVPNVSSTNILIRISDAGDPFLNDVSNNSFTIKSPFITVLSPNGSEIWSGGSGQTITWTSQDVDFVKIEYTIDGGLNWFEIASSVNAAAASYAWITPMVNSANMKIRISSVTDPNIFDESNTAFAISVSTLLAIGSVTGYTGMTIEVPVNLYLSSYDEIVPYNLQGKINFDPAKLEFKSAFATDGTLMKTFDWILVAYQEGSGVLKILGSGSNAIDQNGILMKLAFKIKGSGTGTANLTTTRNNWTSNFSNSLVDETMDGSVTYSVLSGNSQIRGDVTLDCAVDINDALAIVNHTIGVTLLAGQSLINADADLDGDVDINDYLEIVMYTVYGYWDAVTLAHSSASVQFGNSAETQNNSVSVPIDVVNTDNVQTLQVQFEYDPTVIQKTELVSCMNQNNCYTSLTEAEPGKSVLSFASPNALTSDFTIANVVFTTNGNAGGSITTKYIVNDGEIITGEPIELGITDLTADQTLPTEYSLKQNYPNPFNPETTIEYSIPAAGMVNLAVYDNIGREITKLVHEYKSAGNYHVSFQGKDLPSGIYFCRLNCNNHYFVTKMILLK